MKSKTLTIRLRDGDWARLKRLARKYTVSIETMIATMVEMGIDADEGLNRARFKQGDVYR